MVIWKSSKRSVLEKRKYKFSGLCLERKDHGPEKQWDESARDTRLPDGTRRGSGGGAESCAILEDTVGDYRQSRDTLPSTTEFISSSRNTSSKSNHSVSMKILWPWCHSVIRTFVSRNTKYRKRNKFLVLRVNTNFRIKIASLVEIVHRRFHRLLNTSQYHRIGTMFLTMIDGLTK